MTVPGHSPLRILYVNGTFGGGSMMSTIKLLEHVARAGHVPTLLRSSGSGDRTRQIYKRATNLEVKLGGAVDAGPVAAISRRIGRRTTWDTGSDIPTLRAAVVENAAVDLIGSGAFDVVVVSSMLRPAWMRIRRTTLAAGVPCVFYLREGALLAHLGLTEPADLLLANSEALCASAASMGHDAEFVPSVVDLDPVGIEPTRQRILMINPSPDYGLDASIEIARHSPDLEFVFQESSTLDAAEVADLTRRIEPLGNVEFRRFNSDLDEVFGDCRVLIAPYRPAFHSARPRVVLEAQHRGIPVVAADLPGLRETAGNGGVFVPVEAGVDEWVEQIRGLEDADTYAVVSAAASAHAARPEVQPEAIVELFISRLESVVAQARRA